jgi:hypothetical protein
MKIEKKKRVLAVCSALLATVIVVGGLTGFVLWQDQKARALAAARTEYETTLSMAEENSKALQDKVEEAEKLLSENPDVEEPACLTTLSAVLAEIEMPDFKDDLKDKSTRTREVYKDKTKKYSVFDKDWMDGHVVAVEGAIQKIKESVEQKIARLKAEEEARIAAELAEQARLAAEEAERARLAEEKRKTQQNSGGSSSGSGSAQFVGAAAYAQAYIGRTDMICDQLVCESLADMGYPYVSRSIGQRATGRWVTMRDVDYERIFPQVPIDQMQAGDVLVSVNPSHVEIYLGNGQSIHGGYTSNQTTVVISRRSKNIIGVYRPY